MTYTHGAVAHYYVSWCSGACSCSWCSGTLRLMVQWRILMVQWRMLMVQWRMLMLKVQWHTLMLMESVSKSGY